MILLKHDCFITIGGTVSIIIVPYEWNGNESHSSHYEEGGAWGQAVVYGDGEDVSVGNGGQSCQ